MKKTCILVFVAMALAAIVVRLLRHPSMSPIPAGSWAS